MVGSINREMEDCVGEERQIVIETEREFADLIKSVNNKWVARNQLHQLLIALLVVLPNRWRADSLRFPFRLPSCTQRDEKKRERRERRSEEEKHRDAQSTEREREREQSAPIQHTWNTQQENVARRWRRSKRKRKRRKKNNNNYRALERTQDATPALALVFAGFRLKDEESEKQNEETQKESSRRQWWMHTQYTHTNKHKNNTTHTIASRSLSWSRNEKKEFFSSTSAAKRTEPKRRREGFRTELCSAHKRVPMREMKMTTPHHRQNRQNRHMWAQKTKKTPTPTHARRHTIHPHTHVGIQYTHTHTHTHT
jgi:hypothetical protein